MTIFAVNRDMEEDFELDVDLRSFEGLSSSSHIIMHNDDVKAVNTEENPDNVAPNEAVSGKLSDGRASIMLPALSWNVIRITK